MGDIYTNPPQSRNEAILRATIDGTEYTAPPQSRIEDLLLELKEAIEQGGTGEGDMKKSVYDSDLAVATAGGIKMFVSQKIGTLPQRVGSLETTAGVLEGEVASIEDTLDTLGTASQKNSTSVVTDSTDLVESGAVYDAIGWGNKNLLNPEYFKQMPTIYSVNGDTVTASSSDVLTWANIAVYPLKKGTYKLSRTNTQGTSSFRLSDDEYATTTTIDASVDEITFTLNSDGGIKVKGFTLSNWTFPASGKFMISKNGGAYEPHHASVSDSLAEKCDNTVIGTVEDGSTASQAYAVGSHAIRNGAFITWKNAKAQGEPINDASDYDSGDVASCLVKRDTFSGTVDNYSNVRITNDATRIVLAVIVENINEIPVIWKSTANATNIHCLINTTQGIELSGTYYYID